MTSTVSTVARRARAASGMKASDSGSLAVLELDDAAAVALGVLQRLADLRLPSRLSPAHSMPSPLRRARAAASSRRAGMVGVQDAAGEVDQQQAMVDLVEHPGQHAGLQRVRRRGGDVAAEGGPGR